MNDLLARDIAPNWLKALKRHKTSMGLAIDDPQYCIVGEAHNFSKRYMNDCDECYRLSLEFAWCVNGSTIPLMYRDNAKPKANYFVITDLKEYRQLFREFLVHFNQEHKAAWYMRQVKP